MASDAEKPFDVEERQRLVRDGVKRSTDTTNLAHRRLVGAMADAGTTTTPNHTALVTDVWTIVDSSNRLRLLIDIMPGLKKKAPPNEVLRRQLKAVEEFRHYVQHLDKEILGIEEGRVMTAFGTISWIVSSGPKDLAVVTAIPGSLAKGLSAPVVNPAGKTIRPPIDHIELAISEGRLAISELVRAIEKWVPWFESETT